MALQPASRPPLVRLSQSPQHSHAFYHLQQQQHQLLKHHSSSSSMSLQSQRLHASLMRDIPAAADTARRTRANNAASVPRTVFLLDWDDTLCATSFLERVGAMADLHNHHPQSTSSTSSSSCTTSSNNNNQSHVHSNNNNSNINNNSNNNNNINNKNNINSNNTNSSSSPSCVSAAFESQLRLLEQRVLSLLRDAIRLGTVLIVTNAGDGWVELSSATFLPAVRAFLDTHRRSVGIISARARYIEAYRQHPLRWKALTFSDVLHTLLAEKPARPHELHVVVLGDSIGDQFAAHYAADSLTAAGCPIIMKVVKFLERPSIEQLCKELTVLLDHLTVMTKHRGSFDVSMYKETCVNNNNNNNQVTQQLQHSNQVAQSNHINNHHHHHNIAHGQIHTYHHHQNSMQNAMDSRHIVAAPNPTVAPALSAESSLPAATPLPSVATCAAAV